MFAKLAIVVNVLVYIVDINIVVYVMCGVVCCVVPLYLQASVTEGANIRAVMPLLKVAKVVAVKSAVATRKRCYGEAHIDVKEKMLQREHDEPPSDDVKCLGKLECHFKEFDGLSTSVDVEA